MICRSKYHIGTLLKNALLKSDVTRRRGGHDHLSVVMDPCMNAGSGIVNFIVNFIRDGTVFA